jgi:hypothetical protein
LESQLSKYGDLKWEYGTVDYLGVHLVQQPDYSIKADITAMTERILDRRQVTKTAKYPSPANLFELYDDPKSDYSANQNDFLAQVMEINYLTKIRVDIVTTITHLASIAKNPGPVAYKLLAQLHAYLNRTKAFNIVYGTKDPSIHVYCDASYANHPQDSKSHGGVYVTLGAHTGPIYVRSSKIKAVCTSICEAELFQLVEGVRKTYNVAKLLHELGAIDSLHFTVHEDNEATIIIGSAGEGRTPNSKHFRVRFDFLKDLIADGTIKIVHCPTEEMTADYLTKGMVGELYVKLTTAAMGLNHAVTIVS